MTRKKISPEDFANIVSEYTNGNSTIEIAKKVACSKNTIRNILIKQNISLRKPKEAHRKDFFNQSYFSNGVVSQEHAYILGLLFADGYNSEKYNLVKLDLKETDLDILEKIKFELSSTTAIKKYTNNTTYGKCNIVRLQVISEIFSKDLANLGCIQKKITNIRISQYTRYLF